MEILDSLLGQDIINITRATTTFTRYTYTLELHNPNETVNPFKVLTLDVVRDYENNYSDETIVKVFIPAGMYTYHVYPFLDQLEATLYKIDAKADSSSRLDGSSATSKERFKATVINPPAAPVEHNGRNLPTEANLDLTTVYELEIQLVNKTIEQMRLRLIGTIYRNCLASEVIKQLLTAESTKLDVSSEYLPKGVDLYVVDKPIKRDHIAIPQGTRMVDVPAYIQNHGGGVYAQGLSYFYQDSVWYVYPTYNTNRFTTTAKALTLINVPANLMPGTERTYQQSGDHLTVVATGQNKVLNLSEKHIQNEGNGVRFADASNFMEGFAETGDNKATASRGRTNNEVATITRTDGVNNAPVSPTGITSNLFKEYSALAARDGVQMMVTWENSNPDLIYPGMPVRFKYLEEDTVKEVDGVILAGHHYTHLGNGAGIMSNDHLTTSTLSLFLKRDLFKKG